MNPILRNFLAVLAGIIVGSGVNMLLVKMNGVIIALPEGTDTSTMEGLKNSIPLFEFKHFIFPFLGHALGTLVGALLTYLLAVTNKYRMAMIIGAFFLLGGIINEYMLKSPIWYTIIDLTLAYIPMAWIGIKIAGRKTNQ